MLGTQEGQCEHKMACYGPNVPLPNSFVKAWTAGTSEYETEHLKGDYVKMGWLEWALIQSDWCLHTKRKFGPTKRHQGCMPIEESPCEGTERRRLSVDPKTGDCEDKEERRGRE